MICYVFKNRGLSPWNGRTTSIDLTSILLANFLILPFFKKHLSGKDGIGIDVGCGEGGLTAYVASVTKAKLVGIDIDEPSLTTARKNHPAIHFVKGRVDHNAVPNVGLTYDFAFSNCCLCHLDDAGIENLFMDLFGSTNPGAELVFLIPSIDWAKRNYRGIQYINSGITAIPRYGNRQYFRTPEWYISALNRCGFELVAHTEINPTDERLDERYRAHANISLFSAFVAKRKDALPNEDLMKKAFEIAHDNRRLEIQLFWQRSLFFWGFVAASLIGFSSAYKDHSKLAISFALFGLVCSVVWSLGNRGSKYWQEYWEHKVNFFQHYATGNIFFDREPKRYPLWSIYAPRRMSVSKLTMALSDFAVAFFIGLVAYSLIHAVGWTITTWAITVLAALTAIYCGVVVVFSKSED